MLGDLIADLIGHGAGEAMDRERKRIRRALPSDGDSEATDEGAGGNS